MAVIAVAGGTGNVGRTIVEAIVAAGKHEVKILARKARAFLENETKDLEYAVVHNGFFLDYWAPQAEKSNMTPFTLFIDIPNDSAAIPGSGNVPSAFTHTRDVAKFVAAALDLKKWDNDLYIVGDKVTWNEFLKLAEDAKGTKFNVAYDSAEKLKAGQTTELPGQIPAYPFFPKEAYQALAGTFGWWFENGTFDIPPSGKKTLNELFPEIKAWKVKEILDKAWKKA
ncbi:hypothetical protein Brms1b_012668 [Colletotrichum noveboracense]|nr:hypothetical protein Brms1b_012668 [Colletotrichum noveboracense]